MSGLLTVLLAVTILTEREAKAAWDAGETGTQSVAASEKTMASGKKEKKDKFAARITSRSSDFDGQEGVALFEGNVVVRYSNDLVLCADRIYLFSAGTNELSRVVAVGGVSITNDTRFGSCERAIYRHRKGEIEMFGDEGGKKAVLRESEADGQSLAGTRIKFWLEAEQVEVENSTITSDRKGGNNLYE